MTFDKLRREYVRGTLLEADMATDPIQQFQLWFEQAQASDLVLPDAMVLATADAQGVPNARTVLLRGIDENGLVFYTNYASDKARELDANPRATLHFHWNALERQLKVSGVAARTSRESAQAYWKQRPRGGQVGGWASAQSAIVKSRAELDERAAEIEREYENREIPCPPDWGGYLLEPESFEFWQGRPNRLHDRLRYQKESDGSWRLERLAP